MVMENVFEIDVNANLVIHFLIALKKFALTIVITMERVWMDSVYVMLDIP